MDVGYAALARLGRLPNEADDIPDGRLEAFEDIVRRLPAPCSADEATVLANAFPGDACFGAEWTLIHLIERTPAWPPRPGDRRGPAAVRGAAARPGRR